jgi:hypothetical protein
MYSTADLPVLIIMCQQYETSYMIPAQSNHETAGYTLNELLAAVPGVLGMRGFAEKLAICLIEDIVREAMMSVYRD